MNVSFEDFGFYHVDTTYLKYLHDEIDSEVYYSEEKDYGNKPFLGVLLVIDSYHYFIPLTSRKPKHAKWKNVGASHYLIYEVIDKQEIRRGDVVKPSGKNEQFLKIFAALDIKKMIPVPKELAIRVDFKQVTDKRYGDLMEKEYRFCQSVQDGILSRASQIYKEQKETGIVHKMYCDFSQLEIACDRYEQEHKKENL